MSPERARMGPIDPHGRYLLIRRWIALADRAHEIEAALRTPKVVVDLVGLVSLNSEFSNRRVELVKQDDLRAGHSRTVGAWVREVALA
jgi:hypothetical protein